MEKLLVVYKFGKRFDGKMSPKQGLDCYFLHALGNDRKVLFTVDKAPRVDVMDYICGAILMTADGKAAIKADVTAVGKFSVLSPPSDYLVPSVWNNECREKKCWFALHNLEKITISRGDFVTTGGKDLLDAMRGRGYMSYVYYEEENNERN